MNTKSLNFKESSSLFKYVAFMIKSVTIWISFLDFKYKSQLLTSIIELPFSLGT